MKPHARSGTGQHLTEIIRICKNRKVRRLAVFGSAAGNRFDPEKSDPDLLTEFERMSPADHVGNYFGLAEDPEKLFSRPVDLVEPGPIRNPYFRKIAGRDTRSNFMQLHDIRKYFFDIAQSLRSDRTVRCRQKFF
jgi:hypothetical protein